MMVNVFSNKFYVKSFLAQMKDVSISKVSWTKGIYYWVIDSKYRTIKRLDHFLKDQMLTLLPNVSVYALEPDFYEFKHPLYNIAQENKGTTHDETVISVLKYVYNNYTYLGDLKNYGSSEYWAKATEILSKGADDCLHWKTKLLTADNKLINICNIKVGDHIIGKNGKPVKVLNKWEKGYLPTKKIILNNNGEIIATPDHKFLTREGKEIKCYDLEEGTFLKELDSLSCSQDSDYNKDYWYLKGLFIADGWTDNEHKSVFISGKDGFKKEKQKEWVKNYCEKNGLNYTWNERYIVIRNKDLFEDFVKCGKGAINKRVDVLPTNKENILSLIDGLKADAAIRIRKGYEEIVFGTISSELKNQIRVLYKMLGVNVSTSFVEPTRTQFGKNPIWRIYVRKKPIKLKVKKIIDWCYEPVFDIEVEDHEFYLPEADIMVHNCDGLNSLIYVLCRLAGVPDYLLWNNLGPVKGGYHYWLTYFSLTYDRLIVLDATYWVDTRKVVLRPSFKLSKGMYRGVDYCFNENVMFKSK